MWFPCRGDSVCMSLPRIAFALRIPSLFSDSFVRAGFSCVAPREFLAASQAAGESWPFFAGKLQPTGCSISRGGWSKVLKIGSFSALIIRRIANFSARLSSPLSEGQFRLRFLVFFLGQFQTVLIFIIESTSSLQTYRSLFTFISLSISSRFSNKN